MERIRKVLISVSAALAVAGFGALLLFGLPVTGWKALSVQTGSMRPNIEPGSLVLVHRVPASSLKIGDVITYADPKRPAETITHRITETFKVGETIPAFVTQGDANPSPDQPIVGGQVKGKVYAVVPYLGHAVDWIKTWPGIILLVYLPALLVIIEELKRLVAYFRAQLPYVAHGYKPRRVDSPHWPAKVAVGSMVCLLAMTWFMAKPVRALLTSNTVSLTGNRITVASQQQAACDGNGSSSNVSVNISGSGGGSSTNNVNVSNNTNQTAQSGNATVSNNTSGGSATSGNASNCSSTNVNISIQN